jgi:hypothetical protein
MWLWSSRKDFTTSFIPVYLQLSDGGQFRSISIRHLSTEPNDVATVGNILELLLWNSFQCRRFFFLFDVFNIWNIRPSKADFTSGNSQKSLGTKPAELGGCSISVVDFGARNCLTEMEHCHGGESNRWDKIQICHLFLFWIYLDDHSSDT